MVHNHDDPTIPASTFRAWFIGTIFVVAGYVDHRRILRTPPNAWYLRRTFADRLFHRGFINQFFSIRQPSITVSASVAQLLAFPAGKFLEAILPSRQFATFGYTWSLNPGKFNLKEHMVITIMANSTPFTNYVRQLLISPPSPARDWRSTAHLGPAPSTLPQPGVRFELRIPECVVPTTPIRTLGRPLFQLLWPSPSTLLVTVSPA